MIYFVTSANLVPSTTPGAHEHASEFARRFAALSNEIDPSVDCQLLRNVNGLKTMVHWVSKHKSLAAFEEGNKTFWRDERTHSLVAELQEAEAKAGTIFFGNRSESFYHTVDL